MTKSTLLIFVTFILFGCSKETYYSCQGVIENGTIQSTSPYLYKTTEKKNVNITLTVKDKEVYPGGDKSYLDIFSRGYIWEDKNKGEIFFTSTPYEDIGKQYERLHKLYPNENEFREKLDWENNHSSGGTLNKINKTLTLFKNDNTCYKPERIDGNCGFYSKGNFMCSEVKDIK